MTTTTVAAPRLPRANTEPLPSTEGKPQLQKSPTAPAALASPKPPHAEDSFTPAKPQAPKSGGFGDVFGKGKALGGLGGGLFGVGTGIQGLVDDAKNHAGAHDFAGDALGLGKGVLGAVKGGLETAAAFEKVAGAAGKAAGRFVPGLNIGIAAADTAVAANTISNPKASLGDKITSGITAGGSIVSATEIPIVSQIGAGVSLASTAVGAALHHTDFFKKIFG